MEGREEPVIKDQEREEKITVYFAIPSIRGMDEREDKQPYFWNAARVANINTEFYPNYMDMIESLRTARIDTGIAEAQVARSKFESTDGKFLKLKEGEKIQDKDIKRIYLNHHFVSDLNKFKYDEDKREIQERGETKLVSSGYLSVENPAVKRERAIVQEKERELEKKKYEEGQEEFKNFFREITQLQESSSSKTHVEDISLEPKSAKMFEDQITGYLTLMNLITGPSFDDTWKTLGRGKIPDGIEKIKDVLADKGKTDLEKMITISNELKNMPRSLGAQFFSKIGKDPRDPLTNDLYKAAMAGDLDGLSVVHSKLQQLKEEKKQTPHPERK